MKRVGFLFERIADIDNLYEAFRQACRGKQGKAEVLRFRQDLDENLSQLRAQLLSGDVEIGRYHYFTIYDPKERRICAASLPERILHHAIINVCMPYFDSSLIDTTYATRRGKGGYAALDKAKAGFRKYAFSVKLDFRKYYDSIDHQILKSLLRRKFKDGRLLQLLDAIIDSYSVQPGKGLPIGNLTSQYFANAYLSPLDHYVKQQLKAPLYIRYMDDMLIAHNDRTCLRSIYRDLKTYAQNVLCLELKPPVFRNTPCGQVFLGYKVKPYACELSGRSKRRFRTKLISYQHKFDNAQWDEQTYQQHLLPLIAFANHADSLNFRKACMALI